MGCAGVGHLPGPVPLRQHDERATRSLELFDVGIHSPCGRRAERSGGVALGGLGRAGVVDGVISEILRHRLAGIEAFLDLGVSDVADDGQCAAEGQASLDRVLAQLIADGIHRLVQVDLDDLVAQLVVGLLGKETGRVGLELLQEHTLVGDLRPRLPVGGTAHGERNRAGCAVAGQPDHPNVVAEVLAAELGPDAELPGLFENLLFPLEVR